MIYIVVHLFSRPGQLKAMKKYEDKALKIFKKHGGSVVAFKPILNEASNPCEIQILKIKTLKEFNNFVKDPERLKYSEERKRAIKKTKVFISNKLPRRKQRGIKTTTTAELGVSARIPHPDLDS